MIKKIHSFVDILNNDLYNHKVVYNIIDKKISIEHKNRVNILINNNFILFDIDYIYQYNSYFRSDINPIKRMINTLKFLVKKLKIKNIDVLLDPLILRVNSIGDIDDQVIVDINTASAQRKTIK